MLGHYWQPPYGMPKALLQGHPCPCIGTSTCQRAVRLICCQDWVLGTAPAPCHSGSQSRIAASVGPKAAAGGSLGWGDAWEGTPATAYLPAQDKAFCPQRRPGARTQAPTFWPPPSLRLLSRFSSQLGGGRRRQQMQPGAAFLLEGQDLHFLGHQGQSPYGHFRGKIWCGNSPLGRLTASQIPSSHQRAGSQTPKKNSSSEKFCGRKYREY